MTLLTSLRWLLFSLPAKGKGPAWKALRVMSCCSCSGHLVLLERVRQAPPEGFALPCLSPQLSELHPPPSHLQFAHVSPRSEAYPNRTV